ncbi:hypothetical protein [Rhizobium leguminosarum]|uniref:hypothetical protein n=1 Tax=Rhizobium leguminosarum TaxID=384 RepID=UPI001442150B|nr:hypothetical protein [Rhizobium leguminosarum]MBY5868615.1 hypothetical protein [Rhizobium leguminosarum]NKM08207.1 hypothetical protein [Rhizobium leguminosarum bv. viciae]
MDSKISEREFLEKWVPEINGNIGRLEQALAEIAASNLEARALHAKIRSDWDWAYPAIVKLDSPEKTITQHDVQRVAGACRRLQDLPEMPDADRQCRSLLRRLANTAMRFGEEAWDFLPIPSDHLSGGTTYRVPQGSSSASHQAIIGNLASRPQPLADMALSISRLIEHELSLMAAAKPNDQTQLESWQRLNDFLEHIAKLLSELHEAILAAAGLDGPPNGKLLSAARIVSRLRDDMGAWIFENSKELADSTYRLALLGAGTSFLAFCGAPVVGAFAVTSALVGGEKVKTVIIDIAKSLKT